MQGMKQCRSAGSECSDASAEANDLWCTSTVYSDDAASDESVTALPKDTEVTSRLPSSPHCTMLSDLIPHPLSKPGARLDEAEEEKVLLELEALRVRALPLSRPFNTHILPMLAWYTLRDKFGEVVADHYAALLRPSTTANAEDNRCITQEAHARAAMSQTCCDKDSGTEHHTAKPCNPHSHHQAKDKTSAATEPGNESTGGRMREGDAHAPASYLQAPMPDSSLKRSRDGASPLSGASYSVASFLPRINAIRRERRARRAAYMEQQQQQYFLSHLYPIRPLKTQGSYLHHSSNYSHHQRDNHHTSQRHDAMQSDDDDTFVLQTRNVNTEHTNTDCVRARRATRRGERPDTGPPICAPPRRVQPHYSVLDHVDALHDAGRDSACASSQDVTENSAWALDYPPAGCSSCANRSTHRVRDTPAFDQNSSQDTTRDAHADDIIRRCSEKGACASHASDTRNDHDQRCMVTFCSAAEADAPAEAPNTRTVHEGACATTHRPPYTVTVSHMEDTMEALVELAQARDGALSRYTTHRQRADELWDYLDECSIDEVHPWTSMARQDKEEQQPEQAPGRRRESAAAQKDNWFAVTLKPRAASSSSKPHGESTYLKSHVHTRTDADHSTVSSAPAPPSQVPSMQSQEKEEQKQLPKKKQEHKQREKRYHGMANKETNAASCAHEAHTPVAVQRIASSKPMTVSSPAHTAEEDRMETRVVPAPRARLRASETRAQHVDEPEEKATGSDAHDARQHTIRFSNDISVASPRRSTTHHVTLDSVNNVSQSNQPTGLEVADRRRASGVCRGVTPSNSLSTHAGHTGHRESNRPLSNLHEPAQCDITSCSTSDADAATVVFNCVSCDGVNPVNPPPAQPKKYHPFTQATGQQELTNPSPRPGAQKLKLDRMQIGAEQREKEKKANVDVDVRRVSQSENSAQDADNNSAYDTQNEKAPHVTQSENAHDGQHKDAPHVHSNGATTNAMRPPRPTHAHAVTHTPSTSPHPSKDRHVRDWLLCHGASSHPSTSRLPASSGQASTTAAQTTPPPPPLPAARSPPVSTSMHSSTTHKQRVADATRRSSNNSNSKDIVTDDAQLRVQHTPQHPHQQPKAPVHITSEITPANTAEHTQARPAQQITPLSHTPRVSAGSDDTLWQVNQMMRMPRLRRRRPSALSNSNSNSAAAPRSSEGRCESSSRTPPSSPMGTVLLLHHSESEPSSARPDTPNPTRIGVSHHTHTTTTRRTTAKRMTCVSSGRNRCVCGSAASESDWTSKQSKREHMSVATSPPSLRRGGAAASHVSAATALSKTDLLTVPRISCTDIYDPLRAELDSRVPHDSPKDVYKDEASEVGMVMDMRRSSQRGVRAQCESQPLSMSGKM